MDENKEEKLEAQGWEIGSVEEFLSLTPGEAAYIDLKLDESKEEKQAYEAPAIIYEGELTVRAGSHKDGIIKDVNPEDLFGNLE